MSVVEGQYSHAVLNDLLVTVDIKLLKNQDTFFMAGHGALSHQELSETRLAVQQWEQQARQAGRRLQQAEEEGQRRGQQLGDTQAALQQAIRYIHVDCCVTYAVT